MTYKEKVAWLQRYLKAREKANFLGGCVQEMEAEAQGMRTRLDGMPGAGRDTARLARSVEKVEETRKMWNDQLDRCGELRIELVAELAQEIFVQHYTKLTPKVAAALADKYQSDILTDDEIHSGVINYFLIYLGTEPVGYFALDLGPAGAMCLSRLFLKEKARGQGIGRSIVAYAQKLAEGDGRSRLYMRVWARDLKAEGFAKKCRLWR